MVNLFFFTQMKPFQSKCGIRQGNLCLFNLPMEKVQLVAKEEIRSLDIIHRAGDMSGEDQKVLRAKMQQAMLLGNGYKGKVRILFETNDGPRAVETTVWSADEKGIALKSGVYIPLDSVIDIEL